MAAFRSLATFDTNGNNQGVVTKNGKRKMGYGSFRKSEECFGGTVVLCRHFDTMEKMTQEQALFRIDSMLYKQVGERHGGEKGPDIALQRARGGD